MIEAMTIEELGGAGSLVLLAGLLACLGGVWVHVATGIPLATVGLLGVPAAFTTAVFGWIAYRVLRVWATGERDPGTPEYVRDR